MEIEVRGGAWLDIMNSCFYTEIDILDNGYTLCRDNSTGEYFMLNISREDNKKRNGLSDKKCKIYLANEKRL